MRAAERPLPRGLGTGTLPRVAPGAERPKPERSGFAPLVRPRASEVDGRERAPAALPVVLGAALGAEIEGAVEDEVEPVRGTMRES
jgi:hypothetical protein